MDSCIHIAIYLNAITDMRVTYAFSKKFLNTRLADDFLIYKNTNILSELHICRFSLLWPFKIFVNNNS